MSDKPHDHHERLPTDDDETVEIDPVRDEKRDTKELPRVIDQRPGALPEGEPMSEDPTLHSVITRIEAREKLSDERWATVKAQLETIDAKFAALLTKDQIMSIAASAATETAKELIDEAIRAQWEPINAAMTKIETLTDGITRVFADDQMKRNKFERFVRKHIRTLTEQATLRDTENSDFQERLGNWLIPVLGYNPHYPSDTRKPILVPMVDRMANHDTMLHSLRTEISVLVADRDERRRKEQERREWRQKAYPEFLRMLARAASTPFVVNTAIKILGGSAAATLVLEFFTKVFGQ